MPRSLLPSVGSNNWPTCSSNLPRLLIALLLLFQVHGNESTDRSDHPAIGNRFLELRLDRKGDQILATALVNHLTGRTIALDGDDFTLNFKGLPPLRAENFTLNKVVRKTLSTGQRLILHLLERNGKSKVSVIYELSKTDFFIRRHLEFSSTASPRLDQVEIWNIGLKATCTSQEIGPPNYLRYNVWSVDDKKGFGQPVFLEDTFWGLEFPVGYNRYSHNRIVLTHFPGRTLTNLFISKTAVLGVTAAGEVASQFRTYIERTKGRKRFAEVQVDYNTWTTVSPATESNSLHLIQQFRTNLFDPYGVQFNSFTPDDGWDEKQSLWSLRTNGFPHGFKPLLDALQPMGTKLGLWLSPSSGYEHAGWGAKQGYSPNATLNWFLCQSDPAYRRDMTRIIPDLVRKNQVSFFKMDGFCASCDTDKHAHHLSGRAFGWWLERADGKGVKETARHKPLKMLPYVGEYT